MTYRERMATRVLSVDAYWQELREPGRRTPREIPVPLWPGESLQQYEREFGRWLAVRRLSLATMREEPVTERKYRLQFAQTRVARTNCNAQRKATSSHRVTPSRSLSRSHSRFPSPQRRFVDVQQQRMNIIQRGDRDYVFERRSSPDSGRALAARQTAEQRRQKRSYSREQSQGARWRATTPEAHRAYDTWQARRGAWAEPRPWQDPRGSSPRDAHRQHLGDAQRWTHSPSKLPQTYTGRAVSPQDNNRSASSRVGRSSSPHEHMPDVDDHRKQLLARRVISVDAFREEMDNLRNGFVREDDLKWPHETMVRIPVILWPGETMAQYTQTFERWLDSRNIPLSLLRDNPARERSLWHTFAFMRVGTSELDEPAHSGVIPRSSYRLSPRSHSRSMSSSRSIRRNSEQGLLSMRVTYGENKPLQRKYASREDHQPRRKHSHSPEQRRRLRSPPSSIVPPENPRLLNNKTRRQLLERRILALDIFQKEIEKNAGDCATNVTEGSVLPEIPVPLRYGESIGLYDHRFWTWLTDFHETKESLRRDPSRERKFRMAFAYLRVNRLHYSATVGAQNIHDPLAVLKLARDRFALRSADTNKRQAPVGSEEPSTKRVRADMKKTPTLHLTPDFSSRRSRDDLKKSKSTLSLASYRDFSRASLEPTTDASSARASASTSTIASSPPIIFASSVQVPNSTTAYSAPTIAPSTRSATASSPARSVHLSNPVQVGAMRSPARPLTSSPTSVSFQRKPRTILTAPVEPSTKTVTLSSASVTAQKTKANPTRSSTAVGLTKSLTYRSQGYADTTRSYGNLMLSNAVTSTKMAKPVETMASKNESMKMRTSTDKRTNPGGLRPLLQQKPWSKGISASAASASILNPGVKASPSSTSPAAPLISTPSEISASTAAQSHASPSSVASGENAASSRANPIAMAVAPSQASSNTVAITAMSIPAKAISSLNAVWNDSADTDDAASEPESTPAANEVSSFESKLANEMEEHDGDVMDPDGCCCTKCMHNWAKTLTDHMDRLEQNVGDLKREVATFSGS